MNTEYDITQEFLKMLLDFAIHYWWLIAIIIIFSALNEISKEEKRKKKRNTHTNKNEKNTKTKTKDFQPTSNESYTNSVYYKETQINYDEMIADKGKTGEYYISKMLEKIDEPKKLLFNTYIPTEDNKTTEIDIILIHSTGLYVIESKNFKGQIIGDEVHENWQQVTWINRKPNKYYFYNPIKQNSKHIIALKNLIGNKNIISIIAFGDQATIKKAEHTNQNLYIINDKNILDTINSRISTEEKIYSDADIEEIYNTLKPYSGSNVSQETKQQHIDNHKPNYS